MCNATPIPVEAGETYTISAKDYDDPYGAGFVFYNNGVFVSSSETNNLSITVPAGANQLCYDFRKASSPAELDPSDITEVQLQKGGTATDYEPYGYKIPVTVSSKNLLWTYGRTVGEPSNTAEDASTQRFYNYDEYILGIGYNNKYDPTSIIDYDISKDKIIINTAGGTYGVGFPMQVKPGGTYVFSYDDLENVYPRFITYDSTGTYLRMRNLTSGVPFVLDSNEVCGVFLVNASTTRQDCWITKPQIEEGSTASAYVPYSGPTATYNVYLGDPLRKIGTYIDYIDFETQKVYRCVASGIINQNSAIGKFGGVTSYSAFYLNYDNLPDYTSAFQNYNVLSPTFTYHECGGGNLDGYWSSNYQIGSAVAEGYKRMLFTLPTTITDTTMAKTWLETNPINFFYPSKTTSEASITIPSILLNKGTNVVSVGTSLKPSNMWIKYKGKKS